MAHATVSKQIMELIWCSKAVGQNPDFDYAIHCLVNTIKTNHAKDFGIELEWHDAKLFPPPPRLPESGNAMR